jgi:MYXO-CTERM domain-containing protein
VGEVSIRDLTSDDIAGAQFLYNSGNQPDPAVAITGCSSAPGSGLGGLLLLGLLGLGRRSRR